MLEINQACDYENNALTDSCMCMRLIVSENNVDVVHSLILLPDPCSGKDTGIVSVINRLAKVDFSISVVTSVLKSA